MAIPPDLPRRLAEPHAAAADARMAGIAAIGAGLVAWAGVLLPAAVHEGTRAAMPVLFWYGMSLYAIVFVGQTVAEGHRWERWLAAVQVLLGLGLLFLVPAYTLVPVLLVIGVVSATFHVSLRWALALVIGQSGAVWLAGASWESGDRSSAWVSALVYTGLQLFAVVMVDAQRKEARARTELDNLNGQLRDHHEELVAAQHRLAEASRSAERLRISRDLHDTVGHQLTVLALHLEAAAHLAADSAAAAPVATSRDLARALLADVRRVVGQLRDEQTEHVDLAERLERLAGSVPRPAVHVQLDPGLPELTSQQAEAVLRCAQECITNAARHARAGTMRLDIFGEEDEVIVRAIDDGEGAHDVTDGHGLTGMRERFAQLGGLVTVRTAPGAGFRVVARLPVTAAAPAIESQPTLPVHHSV